MSDASVDTSAPRAAPQPQPQPQAKPQSEPQAQAQAKPTTSPDTTGGTSAPAGSSGQSSFSAGGTDAKRQAQLQGGTSAPQDGNQLIADVSYSKLSSTPEGKQALDDLGISDGKTFRQFADQVTANDAQAIQQLNDVMAKASPSFQGQFAAALGALSPEAGATATQAARAQAGNAQAEGWPEGITNADAKQLEGWGITPQQAQESRDALPELLAAAKAAGDANLPAALEHLSSAAQLAPELTARAMAAMTKDLPDGPLKTALNDPAMPGLLGQIAAGDWSGAAATLAGDPALLGAAGEALASLPGVGKLMDKLGISPGDLPSAGAVLPHLFELGAAVTGDPVDVKGATQALLAIAGEVDGDAFGALMGKLGGPLPDAVKSFFTKLAENPQVQAVAKQLMADPNLPALVDQLANQQWDAALQTLANDPGLTGAIGDALASIPQVQDLLGKMGLTPADLPDLGAVFGDVLKLGQAVTGDPVDVKGAAEAILSIAGKVDLGAFSGLLDKLGGAVPDGVKAFFQKVAGSEDAQKVLGALVANPNVPTLLDQLSKMDWGGAFSTLQQIGLDPDVATAMGNAIADVPQVQALLSYLGFDPAKLPPLGEVLPDLMKLGGALDEQPVNVQAAVEAGIDFAKKLGPESFLGVLDRIAERFPIPDSLKQFVSNLVNDQTFQQALQSEHFAPALAKLLGGDPGGAVQELAQDRDLLAAVGGRVAEALGIPTGVVDVLLAAKDLFGDQSIVSAIQDLGAAIASGDGAAAVSAFERLADEVATKAQDPAEQDHLIQLLDAMGGLPGGIGRLFQDPELNEAIVKSGSAGHLIQSARLLAEGKLEDAAGELYQAASSLLNYGEGTIDVPHFGKLPFTKDGLTMFAKLFGRFFDALPNGVKNKIEEIIGRAVGSAVPIIGDLITGAMDVNAFIDAMKNGDGVDQLLAGGQLVLDASNVLQVDKPFTEPLKFALAALQAVRSINNMADIVGNFQDVLFGTAQDPDQLNSPERAVVEAYLSPEQIAQAQQAYEQLGYDDQAFGSLVRMAQACHVPPDQFLSFVNAMAQQEGGLDNLTGALDEVRKMNPDTGIGMRRFVYSALPDHDLGAYGGSWPPGLKDLGNPDGYDAEPVKSQFQEAFPDIEAKRSKDYDLTPYESLVALGRALGIPPEQFVDFCKSLDGYLKGQGLDLASFAMDLSDKLSWWSIREDPELKDFDPVEWLRSGFTGMYPGLADQFLHPEGDQPVAAAA